jgi:hypothetical protein
MRSASGLRTGTPVAPLLTSKGLQPAGLHQACAGAGPEPDDAGVALAEWAEHAGGRDEWNLHSSPLHPPASSLPILSKRVEPRVCTSHHSFPTNFPTEVF